MTQRKAPLFIKILLGLCGVIAAVVVVTHLLLMSATEEFTVEHTHTELERIARQLSTLPELRSTSPELQQQVQRYAVLFDVRITWIDATGGVRAESATPPLLLPSHANRPERLDALEDGIGVARRLSATTDVDTFYVAIRLQPKAPSPVIRVARPLDRVQASSSRLRETLYWLATATLVGAFIFSYLMARWLVRPIHDFTHQARAIARGQLDHKIEGAAVSVAELQSLAEAISDITAELSRTLGRLRRDSPQLTAVLEAVEHPILIVNPGCQILRTNPSALQSFELLHTDDDLSDAHLEALREPIQHAVANMASLSVQLSLPQSTWIAHITPITRFDTATGAVVALTPQARPQSDASSSDDP